MGFIWSRNPIPTLTKTTMRLDAMCLAKSVNLDCQVPLVRHLGDYRVSAPARMYISFDGWLGQAGLRACTDSRHQTTLLQLPVSASVCRSASPVFTAGLVVLDVIGVGNMHMTGAKSTAIASDFM